MSPAALAETTATANPPLQFVRDRAELVVLGVMVVAAPLLLRDVPFGVYGLGVVAGASVALQAVGLVLVYRSNRIINFSQVQIGVVAATLFAVLVQYQPLLRGLTALCPGCRITPLILEINYWLAVALGLAFAVLLSWAVYVFVVKRFSQAPRLVVTVATIFVVELLGGIQGLLPFLLTTEVQRLDGVAVAVPTLPFDWTVTFAGVRFTESQILLVAAASVAVVLVTAYFRLTRSGVALRAAAENPPRAETLGVNVGRLNGRVWMIAGGLSGVGAIVFATTSPPSGEVGLDIAGTVLILAAAVLARLVSVPLAALAAVVVGIFLEGVVFASGTDEFVEVVLLGVVAVVLLVRSRHHGRADLEQASGWRAAREVRPIPKELRSLPEVRNWLRTLAALAAVGLLGYPWVMSAGQTNLGTLVLIYAMVGMSLLVLTGWAGQISLGQFAFAAVGAYAAAALRLPFVLALPFGALAGAAAAVLVGLPGIRLRGLHLAIITLAFASAVPTLISPTYLGRLLPDALARPVFLGVDLDDQRVFFYVALVVLALVVAAVMGLRRSRTARALIAARDNERAAQSFGINLAQARLAAYAVSGAIAGLAGALFVFLQYGVTPSAFAAEVSVTLFITTVLGGLGSVAGPLIGALYLGVLTVFSTTPLVVFLAVGGGGLLLLLMLPGGLSQLVFSLRDTLLRRLARRRRIVVPSLVADVRADEWRPPRAPIAPKRPGRGVAFRPARYRLSQWAVEEPQPGNGQDREPAHG